MLLHSIDSTENASLKNINFSSKHINIVSIKKETDFIVEKLKKEGYFFNSLDSLVTANNIIYKAFFKLNKKINKIILTNPYDNLKKIDTVHITELPSFLQRKSYKLEKEGNLFSKVKLKNLRSKKDILYADLYIKKSKKRKIDKTIVKGYSKISEKKIHSFLNTKEGDIINNEKLKEISNSIKNLKFVSEIKPPEILFKKDSTLLYIYLKKEKNNSFDGIVNFSSKENNEGVLFTGHLNLELNNVFDTGEYLGLKWEANGEERQNFSTEIELPYLFNSQLTTKVNFKIHKQDSTFINTSLNSSLLYNLNPETSIGITYNSENSQNTLINKTDDSFQDFSNNFLGLELLLKKHNINNFFFSLTPSLGYRYINNSRENQFKLNLETSYLYKINKRKFIFIRNQTGYLNSETNLTNELFRIGGPNSIRGFDEESIFTSKYSFINLEYRYTPYLKSYFYSITDFGVINNNVRLKKISGIGLGYSLTINTFNFNIAYSLGYNDTFFNIINNSKTTISFKSFF